MPEIRQAACADDIDTVRTLFQQYADSLDIDLSFQGFADELMQLPGAYSPPRGALFLAWSSGTALGCVALRPLQWPAVAELKRLYVTPEGRGHGLGVRLSQTAMTFARAAGYQRLRLDTLPSMQQAQRLYERLGFYEIESYRFNPVAGTRYLECMLCDTMPDNSCKPAN